MSVRDLCHSLGALLCSRQLLVTGLRFQSSGATQPSYLRSLRIRKAHQREPHTAFSLIIFVACGPGGWQSSLALLHLPTVLLLVLGLKLSLHLAFWKAPSWCGAADGQSGSPFSCGSPHTQDTGRGAHLCEVSLEPEAYMLFLHS